MTSLKHILAILAVAASCVPAMGQEQTAPPELLVEMPTVPENITRLDQRTNHIVINYWTTFNPKSSFSSLERLDHTMGQFLAFTPYATADTVHLAIDRLIEQVGKAKPQNLLTLAALAEKWCYADSAEFPSEELYWPFVDAVVTNKKAKGPERARFEAQHRQLEGSRVGSKVPDFKFTRADGTTGSLAEVTTPHTLLVLYDPDCTDCHLAMTRLAASYVFDTLIDAGALTVMAIYPGEPDDAWRQDAASLPQRWVVGASPDLDLLMTMRQQPEIYYLDEAHIVEVKDIEAGNALNAFSQFIK